MNFLWTKQGFYMTYRGFKMTCILTPWYLLKTHKQNWKTDEMTFDTFINNSGWSRESRNWIMILQKSMPQNNKCTNKTNSILTQSQCRLAETPIQSSTTKITCIKLSPSAICYIDLPIIFNKQIRNANFRLSLFLLHFPL